ncbi:MAG TPA: VWA domain-containing protein [Acidisarcina sp.]
MSCKVKLNLHWLSLTAAMIFVSALSTGSLATAQASDSTPDVPALHSPPIRVDVHLINVFVNVTNEEGAPVPGLTKEDFSISEDGHPQKVAFFGRESEMPLTISLAIDTSGSVHKDLPIEQEAAHKFVHTLLRPIDLFSLIDFSSDVREVVPFTNHASRIDDGLGRLRPGPATALYDAVYLGAQSLSHHSGRKVLVIISDGDNTVDGVDYARALEMAVRSEVMVYCIIDVPIPADAGRNTGGEHAMITLSQETGGKYYYAEASQLDRALQQVSEDLRTQYSLGYYPAHHSGVSGDFHTISITVKGKGAASSYTVRHRPGYYSTPAE